MGDKPPLPEKTPPVVNRPLPSPPVGQDQQPLLRSPPEKVDAAAPAATWLPSDDGIGMTESDREKVGDVGVNEYINNVLYGPKRHRLSLLERLEAEFGSYNRWDKLPETSGGDHLILGVPSSDWPALRKK